MVEIQQLRTFLFKTSEFAQQPNLHNAAVTSANHQKLEAAAAKKNKKRKIFFIFLSFLTSS